MKKKLDSFSSIFHLFRSEASGLPVDRQQLRLKDQRGAAGDLGRGAHRACFWGFGRMNLREGV